ncbi:hypothetical protein CTI14_69585, partial [Methylobacterium radiotolerans]
MCAPAVLSYSSSGEILLPSTETPAISPPLVITRDLLVKIEPARDVRTGRFVLQQQRRNLAAV